MDGTKKIAEIKNIIRDLSDKLDAIHTNDQLSLQEKNKELEHLASLLYKNILSLNIIEDVRDTFINAARQHDETEEPLPNQLEIDLFKEVQEPPVLPVSEIKTAEPAQPISPVSSISLLPLNIGLNDKFRFIRELFEGSTQEYTIAINQINSITKKMEAYIYIDSLKNIYRWQDDQESFVSFMEIINRRFL